MLAFNLFAVCQPLNYNGTALLERIPRRIEFWANTISRLGIPSLRFESLELTDVYSEHDFFETQPQTSASVFLLKQIMHDWSDRYAARILRRLRDAATPATILCLNEALNLHTCPAPLLPIPGAHIPSPPSPLLTNLGPAKARTNVMDLVMHAHVSGRERTLVEFVELLASTGWKVVQVYHGEYNSQIIAAPIQS